MSMNLQAYLAQHTFPPKVTASLHLLHEKLHDFGLEVDHPCLSKATLYEIWSSFFDSYFDAKEYRYPLYKSALNYLMADDYLITRQSFEALSRSLCFMKEVLATNLWLRGELIAQAMIQLACYYGNHPNRLSPCARLFAQKWTSVRDLQACIALHELLFGRSLAVPGYFNTSKTKLLALERRIFSVLFEERSLRKTLPFLGLSKQEAHLFLYGGIPYLETEGIDRINTLKHYRSIVRLYENVPQHLDALLELLPLSHRWNYEIDLFENDIAFWQEAVRFYITYFEEADFDGARIFLDYIEYKRYTDIDTTGTYSLKDKTLASFNREMNHWHRYGFEEVDLEKPMVTWEPIKFKTYTATLDDSVYKIEEIIDSHTLLKESKVLKHCVYGYVNRCLQDYSRIFGLRVQRKGHFTPCCTIQVIDKTVVQFKGKMNRNATEAEEQLLKAWCELNNFTIKKL